MSHAAVDNGTPHACEHLFLRDEEGRMVLVVLVQATFDLIGPTSAVLAEKPVPVSLTGELWGADASVSSYRVEPAFAFFKPSTDVVLVGHAQSGGRPATELQVTFRVGPVGRTLRVLGDRTWLKSGDFIAPSRPQPFERMPLVYERAFGGWDRTPPDPRDHTFEPRNPVGTGFRAPGARFEDGMRLPNIEDPGDPVLQHGRAVAPAGVGFTSPDWQPRAALAGTYDDPWTTSRCPLLPKDFDRRFFQGASAGLIAPEYLLGNEPVLVENASPLGRLSFRLPGVATPTCRVALARRQDARPALQLDTVIVDTDADRVVMSYRAHLPLHDGPHDVLSIAVEDQVRLVSGHRPAVRAAVPVT
jgi:hypothetical protein